MTTHPHRYARLLALVLPLLPLAAGAQTAPASPPPAAGTYITLGRYEVAASKFGAQSTDLLTSVTVIGADQLENESTDYTLELLGKIPGVTLTDFNQGVITADVSLRGYNGEGSSPHLRLLIDGLPANLNNGYNDLGPIFPLEIERIEVVKGTADPRFGLNAVAGSVNVHTFQSFVGQKLKLMAGSFGVQEGQALAGYRSGKFSQTYFAGYRRSDGYRDHSTLEKHSFAGKWFLAGAADRWRLGLSARVHDFDADGPGYLSYADSRRTPTASPAFSSTDGGTQENSQFSLHGDAQFAPTVTASAKVYRHDVQRHRFVRFTAAGAQQERLENELHSGAMFTTQWRPTDLGLPLTVDAGAEFHRQDARQPALRHRYAQPHRDHAQSQLHPRQHRTLCRRRAPPHGAIPHHRRPPRRSLRRGAAQPLQRCPHADPRRQHHLAAQAQRVVPAARHHAALRELRPRVPARRGRRRLLGQASRCFQE